jgi:aspartate/methionine/tyrosine aminotransferase
MHEQSSASPIMTRDWAFARFLAREIGVVGIPPSAFYDEKDKHLSKNFIRLAFCKEDQSLNEAVKRL